MSGKSVNYVVTFADGFESYSGSITARLFSSNRTVADAVVVRHNRLNPNELRPISDRDLISVSGQYYMLTMLGLIHLTQEGYNNLVEKYKINS